VPISIVTRGPKIGSCNICNEYGSLTEDHTPPKICIKPTHVEIQHISSLLSVDQSQARGARSQNGVKYRTLCHRCNNSLLGAKYDPPFGAFVNGIGSLLRSSYHVARSTSIEAQPQAILRSLIGHIAAQGVDLYATGPLTEAIRDYFLDSSKPFPDGLYAYYWAYPHRPHVMARDAVYMDIPSGESFALWFLKFFPIAFLITWGPAIGLEHCIHEFQPWRSVPYDYRTQLPLRLRPVPPPFWPEAPSDRSMLLYGQEAIHAAGMPKIRVG